VPASNRLQKPVWDPVVLSVPSSFSILDIRLVNKERPVDLQDRAGIYPSPHRAGICPSVVENYMVSTGPKISGKIQLDRQCC